MALSVPARRNTELCGSGREFRSQLVGGFDTCPPKAGAPLFFGVVCFLLCRCNPAGVIKKPHRPSVQANTYVKNGAVAP